ncbi:MAG: type II toxin-antitoxin system VapC family toxin, partial [bacterium]|nr:type II toxin-antitoxin system VapC family toxin [bacterium]
FGPKDKKKRKQTQIHKLGFSENDLWIAAVAKRNNLIIVSADSDFKRMQEILDITIESWYNIL